MKMNKNNFKTYLPVIIGICLFLSTLLVFSYKHAWGAWGGDSPGYILQAAHVYQGKELIYEDDLVQKASIYFTDSNDMQWVLPYRHELLSKDNGIIVSRYPIGMALVYGTVAKLFGEFSSIFMLTILFAAGSVALLYMFLYQLFSAEEKTIAVLYAVAGSILLCSSDLFFSYAVSQPMREIPSIFFLLLAVVLIEYLYKNKNIFKKRRVLLFVFSFLISISLSLAIAIRVTNSIPAIGILLYGAYVFFTHISYETLRQKNSIQIILSVVLIVLITSACIFVPVIMHGHDMNAVTADSLNTSVLSYIAPNASHVDSINASHLITNEGKFRPGEGGFAYYISILEQSIALPFGLLFFCIGIAYLWIKGNKGLFVMSSIWVFGLLLLFGSWINPYSRYILPVIPIVIAISIYGFYLVIDTVLTGKSKNILRISMPFVIMIMMLTSSSSHYHYLENDQLFLNKSISKEDGIQLEKFIDTMQTYEQSEKEPLFIATGESRAGMSSMVMAQSTIRSVRSPYESLLLRDQEKVRTFLDILTDEYEVYVWIDETTNGKIVHWMEEYAVETVAVHDYSFQPWVRLVHVSERKDMDE